MIARLRDLNYEKDIRLKLHKRKIHKDEDGVETVVDHEVIDRVKLADIPVMVLSKWCSLSKKTSERQRVELGECPHDQGGYFIIRGSEKVVVAQERMAFNFIYTFKNSKDPNYPWATEIRSVPKGIASLPAIFKLVVQHNKGQPKILCRVRTVTKDLPLGVLLRALGIQSEYEMFKCVCYKVKELEGEELEDIKGML
jgi:DNA-directed RNA polymerase II subunit RPB2